MIDRYFLGRMFRFFLHLHYDIRVTGEELLRDERIHLVLPNHSAYVDPLILFSEEWRVPICPMVDELFMRHWLFGWVLRKGDAIEVPDLGKVKDERGKVKGESLKAKAEAASQLSRIAIDSLAAGKQLCFYPSGHVKTVDEEVIGNRRMAYEVCRELPQGVRVILCRMRGLESSRFSKLRPKRWKWRRTVTLHFEDHTDDVRQWAAELDRRAFNEKLEEWYNDEMMK